MLWLFSDDKSLMNTALDILKCPDSLFSEGLGNSVCLHIIVQMSTSSVSKMTPSVRQRAAATLPHLVVLLGSPGWNLPA